MNYPNDKSTIFSIAPMAIHEFKPGLYPGKFYIEPCTNDTQPTRLVVGCSDYLMTVAARKQPIRINTPSYQIAKAIVDDFMDGQLIITTDARPGVCWIQGDVSVIQFVEKNVELYESIRENQKRWFVLVIQKTNDDWKKYHHSRVVTDTARFASRALGIPTPEWMTVQEVAMNFFKCPACATMNDPANVVCSGCKAIFTDALIAARTREEKLKSLTFAE